MVIRVDVGVLSTQKRQKYPYYRVLDWNQIPLYTIMRVIDKEFWFIKLFGQGAPRLCVSLNGSCLLPVPESSSLLWLRSLSSQVQRV